MKLGVAGRISVVDLDLSDTQDVSPYYSDVVAAFQCGSDGPDSEAQQWLQHLDGDE